MRARREYTSRVQEWSNIRPACVPVNVETSPTHGDRARADVPVGPETGPRVPLFTVPTAIEDKIWTVPALLSRGVAALAILVAALLLEDCAGQPSSPEVTPFVSIKELMENVIDPISDNIFDAVTVDVTSAGVVETKPVTDEDWAKVRQGAVTLLEGTNLLKIPRRVAPPGDKNNSGGANAPELSPEQIQEKIDRDRALWNSYADQLRDNALKVLEIVKAKNVEALFQAGSDLDKACENCHLEYWYPGDKKEVLEDEKKRVTITPPKR